MRTEKRLDWYTIHKIKMLYDRGTALSINQISQEMNLSRTIVKRYLDMSVEETVEYLKKLDNQSSKPSAINCKKENLP